MELGSDLHGFPRIESGNSSPALGRQSPAGSPHAGIPPRPRYVAARRAITKTIGRDRVAEFERGNPLLDIWWGTWPLLAVAATASAIAVVAPVAWPAVVAVLPLVAGGPAGSWWMAGGAAVVLAVLMVLQGFNIVNCAIVAHSLSTHRRPWGERIGRWHGTVLSAVALRSGTPYTASHIYGHHPNVGTPVDQDPELSDLDRSWKRLVAATPIGFLLVNARAFVPAADRDRIWPVRRWWARRLREDPRMRRILRAEAAYTVVSFAVLAVLAWRWPFLRLAVLVGWGAPLVLFAAAAHSVREVTEHFDLDLDDPFQVATLYEPGWFLRVFAHQTGVIHWVHHLWPDMPHYRCLALWREIRPLLEVFAGVEVRTSWWEIAQTYYLGDRARLRFTDATGRTIEVRSLNPFGDPALAAARR